MVARLQEAEHLAALERVIAAFAASATIDEIAAAAKLPISRRTLQRRLAALVEQGRIVSEGQTRALRYRVTTLPAEVKPQPPPEPQVADAVPLSPPALEIRQLVRRHIVQRTPTGYQRAFLDGYRPNETAYLTTAEKQKLSALGRPSGPEQPAGTHAQNILNRLLIDLAWNSSRLEGNTYSLLDTERLLAGGAEAEGKPATEAQMILNHKAAIEFLVQDADHIAFNRATILNLHALLSENLMIDPASVGRLRTTPVGIGGSVYHPLSVPQVIVDYFDQMLATAAAIRDPFEQALFIMVQLPYLQPFEDVNKRTSRLAANIPFIRGNLSPVSFVDVPKALYTEAVLGVYELNRTDLLKDVFLWAYERSAGRYAAIAQTIGEPDPFRLRHRQALRTLVAEIIRAKADKKRAAKDVAAWAAANISEPERARFIEVVETELLALHEGSYARYRVRPSEFEGWYEVWNARPAAKIKPGKGKKK
ncbi:MAG: Fic family protein [Hyphomicrobium sp.]|nr:Fic family protein [Hyphomicrobium sp.]